MRVKTGVVRRQKHNKIRKMMRGQWGSRHRLWKRANEAWMRSYFYAYRDRRQRRRQMRRLWIIRINAAARLNGMSYSRFMHGLKLANVALDRKSLAELAVRDYETFRKLAALSQQHLRV
ncbi:MAG: 50S ribosomal protein L20 [Anaerolineae bacterium]|nr:50S ribosomal protein L20 [Anaerolineae bacterium]